MPIWCGCYVVSLKWCYALSVREVPRMAKHWQDMQNIIRRKKKKKKKIMKI
jgi:hypothetical protein